MRITYIHQHYKLPGQPGGSRPHQFARRLVRDGHKVTLIAAGEGPTEVAGYHIKWIPVSYDNRMGTAQRIRSFLTFMAKASAAAVRVPSDVVVASSTPLTVAVPGMMAALTQRAEFVFEARDVWPEVPIALGKLPRTLHTPAKLLERLTYQRARSIIALSPGMRDSVLRAQPDADVHVIPNAADQEDYAPLRACRSDLRRKLGIPQNTCYVVYAGSLGYIYDPAWLANFAIQLHQSRIAVRLFGKGAGLEDARALVEQAGLPGKTILPGPLPRDEVMEHIAAADWALSSIIDEPVLEAASLNKVFDAWSVGTPVIFNHGGWLADLGAKTGAGLRVPRNTVYGDAADAMCSVFDEPSQRRRSAAAELAATTFDRERLYRQWRRVVTGK